MCQTAFLFIRSIRYIKMKTTDLTDDIQYINRCLFFVKYYNFVVLHSLDMHSKRFAVH